MVAPLLVPKQVATLRALPSQVLGYARVLRLRLSGTANVLLQNAGNGISAGEYGLALLPGNGGAADAS